MAELVYTYPTHELTSGGLYANPTAVAHTDRASNLTRLWNGLVAESYCGSVRFRFRTFELGRPADALEPIVTSFYPTYQETIFGTEGVIVAQRVFVPFRSGYNEAVCWQLDLQAEGHRLLQIEIEIDWDGIDVPVPLTQRYKDGLIVVHGGHSERATRVFGANGPPTIHGFSKDGTTQLIYHVLIEGYIDLPFILTMAPSGEQLAWNGFLALSDLALVAQDSNRQMADILDTAAVVTPEPAFNRGLAWAKAQLMKGVRRGRLGIGFNPDTSRDLCVTTSATAARALAWLDNDESREIVDKLRRLAQTPVGGIAAHYDHYSGEQTASPGIDATVAYLSLLRHHLLRSGDDGELQTSAMAASAWLETQGSPAPPSSLTAGPDLAAALTALWTNRERQMPGLPGIAPGTFDSLYGDLRAIGHILPEVSGQPQKALMAAATYLILALESVAGLTPVDYQTLLLHPSLPPAWPWLLILNLPYGDHSINCIYDNGVIYADSAIRSPLPVIRCDEIARLPSERIALAVTQTGRNRVLVANPEAGRWSGQVRAFGQQLGFELESGQAQWLEPSIPLR